MRGGGKGLYSKDVVSLLLYICGEGGWTAVLDRLAGKGKHGMPLDLYHYTFANGLVLHGKSLPSVIAATSGSSHLCGSAWPQLGAAPRFRWRGHELPLHPGHLHY